MAQRSRIWEMLEDATKNLMSKFDDEGKEIVEEDGWESTNACRCTWNWQNCSGPCTGS